MMLKKINQLKESGEYFTDISEFINNNQTLTIQNQWFPVYEHDIVTSYAIISSDITTQVQLETDKRRSENALEQALIQQKMAEEKNRLKSDFLANMSHELRKPLNSIMGYAQLLQLKPLGDKEHYYVNEMFQSSEHLLTLINGLLDLSKIEAGKVELYNESFSLPVFLEEIADTSRTLVEQKNNKLLLNIVLEGYALNVVI